MSRRVKLVAFCLILAIFATSNPSRTEYLVWARQHSAAAGSRDEGQAGDALGRIMTSILGVPIAEAETRARNWFFFSVYDCLTEAGSIRVVGVLRCFAPISLIPGGADAPSIPPVRAFDLP